MNNLNIIIKRVADKYKRSDMTINKEVNRVISGDIRSERKILNNYRRGNRR